MAVAFLWVFCFDLQDKVGAEEVVKELTGPLGAGEIVQVTGIRQRKCTRTRTRRIFWD